MKYWFLWLLVGVISLIGGFFALANPLAATLTAELMAGWMFVVVGIMTVVSAFQDRGWGGRILAALLGIAILVLGINLVGNPLRGAISLTFITAALLLILGVFRILLAFGADTGRVRGALILSGAISLILGIMIFSNFPQSAAVVLGTFLAVELISNGVSLIVLSLSRKTDAVSA